jgi:hypothetical protein
MKMELRIRGPAAAGLVILALSCSSKQPLVSVVDGQPHDSSDAVPCYGYCQKNEAGAGGDPAIGELGGARDARSESGNADAARTDAVVSGCTKSKTPATVSKGTKGKSDILFVVDSSADMSALQQLLLGAAATLESALESTTTPNYRIGVITTDLGISPYAYTSCKGCGDAAQLQAQTSSVCSPPATKYLENASGTKNFTGTLVTAFKCLASVGTSGCGFEQPLEAAAVFLTNTTTFLRPDASLVIVFVSSEDDCSAGDASLYNSAATSYGAMSSYRCTAYGIGCNESLATAGTKTGCKADPAGSKLKSTTDYAALFKSLKVSGRVAVVAIAGPVSPFVVTGSGTTLALSASCSPTTTLSIYPAVRLKAVVDAFGTAGSFSSACTSSLATAMQKVGSFATSL